MYLQQTRAIGANSCLGMLDVLQCLIKENAPYAFADEGLCEGVGGEPGKVTIPCQLISRGVLAPSVL